jgi:hypothetical protein
MTKGFRQKRSNLADRGLANVDFTLCKQCLKQFANSEKKFELGELEFFVKSSRTVLLANCSDTPLKSSRERDALD